MSIAAKIMHGWGFTCPDQVELSWTGSAYIIVRWPTENPPTIAEIEAVQLPATPDWRSFQTAITVSPSFMRIAGHNGQTITILPTLVYVCSLIESDATRAVQFAGLWNAIATIAEPTSDEITALNSIASASNVPFQLNSAGLIA
jgi:hypothetical protein